MAEQARYLKKVMGQKADLSQARRKKPQIIAITSGKGGVGKTSLAVNLAIALSQAGKKVMIMDADLGMANVDIILGIVPRFTLSDVLAGDKSLQEVVVSGAAGIKIIPGCSGIFALQNISSLQKQNLTRELDSCAGEMDYVLIDTGAGVSSTILGFLAAADDVLMIITPEPTSLTDGYAIIKILSKFKLKKRVLLVVNMADDLHEAGTSAQKIETVAAMHLDIEIIRLGFVNYDETVIKSVKEMTPFILKYPRCQASRDIARIAGNLMENKSGFDNGPGFAHKLISFLK